MFLGKCIIFFLIFGVRFSRVTGFRRAMQVQRVCLCWKGVRDYVRVAVH